MQTEPVSFRRKLTGKNCKEAIFTRFPGFRYRSSLLTSLRWPAPPPFQSGLGLWVKKKQTVIGGLNPAMDSRRVKKLSFPHLMRESFGGLSQLPLQWTNNRVKKTVIPGLTRNLWTVRCYVCTDPVVRQVVPERVEGLTNRSGGRALLWVTDFFMRPTPPWSPFSTARAV